MATTGNEYLDRNKKTHKENLTHTNKQETNGKKYL